MTPSPIAQNALPTVVSVGDGDTLRVRKGGKTITVRFACVDAPEIAQAPWGRQAADRLKNYFHRGKPSKCVKLYRQVRAYSGGAFLGQPER